MAIENRGSELALARLDDAELARRIAHEGAASDEEAELCQRYVRRLIAFGRRRLGNDAAAEDLAQDCLLLVLQKLRAGEVREPERIGAFILGVARTLVGMRFRAREEQHESVEGLAAEVAAAAAEPFDVLAHDQVAHCLEALPEKQRAVMLLSFYAEESSAAIGASLGLSVGNVRVLRHRSVLRLRDCLGLDLGGAA